MRRRFLLIWTLALLTAGSAFADNKGESLIGLCKSDYPCAKVFKLFEGSRVLRFGFLGTTFGNRCPCLRRLLRDPRQKQIRVHAVNGPCLRNGRCGRYEPFAGETIRSATRKLSKTRSPLLRKVERAVSRVAALVPPEARQDCFCSVVLETDFPLGLRRRLGALCTKHMPECRVVDNPVRPPCVAGMVCEIHGSTPGLRAPCIADIDGDLSPIRRSEFHRRYAHCEMSLWWEPQYNCNSDNPRAFINPRRRVCGPLWR